MCIFLTRVCVWYEVAVKLIIYNPNSCSFVSRHLGRARSSTSCNEISFKLMFRFCWINYSDVEFSVTCVPLRRCTSNMYRLCLPYVEVDTSYVRDNNSWVETGPRSCVANKFIHNKWRIDELVKCKYDVDVCMCYTRNHPLNNNTRLLVQYMHRYVHYFAVYTNVLRRIQKSIILTRNVRTHNLVKCRCHDGMVVFTCLAYEPWDTNVLHVHIGLSLHLYSFLFVLINRPNVPEWIWEEKKSFVFNSPLANIPMAHGLWYALRFNGAMLFEKLKI